MPVAGVVAFALVATLLAVGPAPAAKIRISGGRGRLNLGRGMNSLDDLIATLNGGDHANDLIVKGFGRTVTQVQDVIVRGRGGVTIQVVR